MHKSPRVHKAPPARAPPYLLAVLSACTASPPPAPSSAPPATCDSHPALCGINSEFVAGGESPDAFVIVFVGDGFTRESLGHWRTLVDSYVADLTRDSFVSWDPDMYKFHRLDVISQGDDVNDADRTDTPLAATLDPESDSCGDAHIITDDARVQAAISDANLSPDLVVVVAQGSIGRGNSRVHVSSQDSYRVVEHELAHALFDLGDEYTEFFWCSERSAADEADLLVVPNVTSRPSPTKWLGRADGVEAGGSRWPCQYHPTDQCVMLDPDDGVFCPVCEAAIRERVAIRRCAPDRLEPRVTIIPPTLETYARAMQGSMVVPIEAAGYDERGIDRFRFFVDGALVQDGPSPWLDLDLRLGERAAKHIEAEAVDPAGHGTRSAPYVWNYIPPEPTLAGITTAHGGGWARFDVTTGPWPDEVIASVPGRDPVVVPGRSAVTRVSVPLGPGSETTEVSLVAHNLRGDTTSATTLTVPPPQDPPAPVINSVRLAGYAGTLELAGDEFVASVSVESCAPLNHVVVETSDGHVLGSVTVEPRDSCEHQIAVPIDTRADFGQLRAVATNRWNQTGAIDLPWSRSDATLADRCGFTPARLFPGRALAISRPVLAELGPPGQVATADIHLGPVQVPLSVVTRAEHRVSLITATHLTEPQRDGDLVRLVIAVGADCGGTRVVGSYAEDIVVDNRPPEVRAHRYGNAAGHLVVEATDGGDIAQLEATWANGETQVVGPGQPIVARPGVAHIKATDSSGNASRTRTRVVRAGPVPMECEVGL